MSKVKEGLYQSWNSPGTANEAQIKGAIGDGQGGLPYSAKGCFDHLDHTTYEPIEPIQAPCRLLPFR